MNFPRLDGDLQLWESLTEFHADYLMERGIPTNQRAFVRFSARKEADRMHAEKHPDLIVAAFGDHENWVPTGKVGIQTADGKRYIANADSYDPHPQLNFLSDLAGVQSVEA